MQKLMEEVDVEKVVCDQCMYGCKTLQGAPVKKPTQAVFDPEFRWPTAQRLADRDGLLTREQPCGKFKGYVRVMQKDVPPPVLPIDMAELFIEKRVVVRLYLLKGYNLPPMDLNGSTDSYPVIKLAGKGDDAAICRPLLLEQREGRAGGCI